MGISCEKENELTTKEKLLIEGVWLLSKAGVDSNNNQLLEPNEIGEPPNCQKDDETDFQKNGILIHHDKGLRCDAMMPDQTTLNWWLEENETVLGLKSFYGNVSAITYHKIIALTNTTLILTNKSTISLNPIFEYSKR